MTHKSLLANLFQEKRNPNSRRKSPIIGLHHLTVCDGLTAYGWSYGIAEYVDLAARFI